MDGLQPEVPKEEVNPFVKAVLYPDGDVVRHPEAIVAGNGSRRVRKIVGYLDKYVEDHPRRLFTSDRLDEGVYVPEAAIRGWQRLDASAEDGLARDVLWVDHGADVIYWSTRPPETHSPEGGNGIPPEPFRRRIV